MGGFEGGSGGGSCNDSEERSIGPGENAVGKRSGGSAWKCEGVDVEVGGGSGGVRGDSRYT